MNVHDVEDGDIAELSSRTYSQTFIARIALTIGKSELGSIPTVRSRRGIDALYGWFAR